MARLRSTERLRLEDFPKDQRWVNPIVNLYNRLIDDLRTILNGGVTFADNIVGLDYIFDFEFRTQAETFPRQVSWPSNISASPTKLWTTRALEDDDPIAVLVTWKYGSTRQIELLSVYKLDASGPSISDLTAGSRYKISVRAEP